MKTILEPARETVISDSCDVLVAGGGFAGISAALAAARNGKNVLLIEKEYELGGLGTAGLVTIFLPLCDGAGRQLIFGIGEELLRLSIQYGYEARYPKAWLENGTHEERVQQRFQVRYNAHLFAIAAEQLLLKEGVRILYGTSVTETVVEDGKLTAVLIENKSGRSAITLTSAVDATGDADLFWLSGAKTAEYGIGNFMAGWYYYYDGQKFDLQMIGVRDDPDKPKTAPDASRRFSGIDAVENSEFMQLSHAETLKHVLGKRETNPDYMPVTIATIPQFRMTRRPEGCYVQHDTEMHQYFEDSVGLFGDWRKRGPAYEMPFRTLYGTDIRNLIAAGRCISVTDAMWDITRVIPVCCVSGEAAGTAAAMSDDFAALDVAKLQAQLEKQGVVLHL